MTGYSRYNMMIGILSLLVILTGCRQEYERMALQASGDFTQPTDSTLPATTFPEDDPQPGEQRVTKPEEAESVPAVYALLSAAQRKTVFDQLLGQARDVFILQESGEETYAAFDEDSQIITHLAQAHLLGDPDNSILLFLGITFADGQSPTVNVLTFEKGRSPDIQRYKAGKEDFLKQFSNVPMIADDRQIQGITGATPVWKPIAQQIQESYSLLLDEKSDPAWIVQIKQNGKIWHRSVPEPSESVPPNSVQPQESTILPDPPTSAVIHPMAVFADSFDDAYDFEPTENLTANSGQDYLYKHWQVVAAVEITLLVCGLLIIVTMQIVRAVYK
jgi:hypothetical protein